MKNRKEIIRWLQKNDLYDRFIDNMTTDIKDYNPKDNELFIVDAFGFYKSNEGLYFWQEVSHNFRLWYFSNEKCNKSNNLQLWIARDQSGAVYIHTSKPRKNKHGWTSGCCPIGACNRDSFPEIKWEDEDPTEIEITINK